MIVAEEPEVVTIKPWHGTFWHHGRQVAFAVSKSIPNGTWARVSRNEYLPRLDGQFGRNWLADPCSAILDRSMEVQQWQETEDAKLARAAKRKAKAEYIAEARHAELGRARRRAW